jgi:tetratricopeptide (TPR) repeat protein
VAEALQYLEIAVRNQPDDEGNAELLGRLAHLTYRHRSFKEAARLLTRVSRDQRSKGHLAAALESEVRLTDSTSHFVELPLSDFIGRLEEIKSEARREELWEVLAEALDVELHLLDRIPDSVRARRVFEEARECVAYGSTVAKVRAWSTLAIEIYYGDPAVALEAARRAVAAAFSGRHSSVLPKALDRLLLVLMHQGLFETDEGKQALSRATELAAQSGDLYFKFNVRSNEGVWCLDTGELDRAAAAFARTAEVVQQTDVDWPSLALRLNLGELSLARSDFSEAARVYAECRERLGPSTPRWAEWVIHAGSGLSALESGDLSTARACESALGSDPDEWVFDPYLVTLFRARLLQRRGKRAEAADRLRLCAQKLEGRLVLSWVRLKLAEARMLVGYENRRALLVAEEGLGVAEELGLRVRKRQFQHMLEKAT